MPTADATDAEQQGLEQQAAHHLAPGGADGPQQGDLAGPLGDDHRERVPDDERADEQGDAGEDHEQDR